MKLRRFSDLVRCDIKPFLICLIPRQGLLTLRVTDGGTYAHAHRHTHPLVCFHHSSGFNDLCPTSFRDVIIFQQSVLGKQYNVTTLQNVSF